jgi:hypothetical protein
MTAPKTSIKGEKFFNFGQKTSSCGLLVEKIRQQPGLAGGQRRCQTAAKKPSV